MGMYCTDVTSDRASKVQSLHKPIYIHTDTARAFLHPFFRLLKLETNRVLETSRDLFTQVETLPSHTPI